MVHILVLINNREGFLMPYHGISGALLWSIGEWFHEKTGRVEWKYQEHYVMHRTNMQIAFRVLYLTYGSSIVQCTLDVRA